MVDARRLKVPRAQVREEVDARVRDDAASEVARHCGKTADATEANAMGSQAECGREWARPRRGRRMATVARWIAGIPVATSCTVDDHHHRASVIETWAVMSDWTSNGMTKAMASDRCGMGGGTKDVGWARSDAWWAIERCSPSRLERLPWPAG
jgi:hypothetical protein